MKRGGNSSRGVAWPFQRGGKVFQRGGLRGEYSERWGVAKGVEGGQRGAPLTHGWHFMKSCCAGFHSILLQLPIGKEVYSIEFF